MTLFYSFYLFFKLYLCLFLPYKLIIFQLDTLFVQYHKLCAQNIVVLPELENAITEKNVLVMHIRESLKKIDELLKCLKDKNVKKLKEVEQKFSSIKIEVDSVSKAQKKILSTNKLLCT